MSWRVPLLAGALLCAAAPSPAAWLVDEHGACVRRWTPRSLLIGPAMVLDAPLVPIRFIAGGAVQAAECPPAECSGGRRVWLGTAGVLLGAVYGPLVGFMDLGMGVFETLTGGYGDLFPPDPTRLTLRPIRFVAVGDSCCVFARPRDPTVDRCGRGAHRSTGPNAWDPPWWRRFPRRAAPPP